jgi:cytochrome c oxidase subunit 1/cytochrome c oxidase subunit I+III
MHFAGMLGMPRRVYTYPSGLGWDIPNLISTIGAFILAAGFLWTFFVFAQSLLSGPRAPDDPWGANTLEWVTGSPPKPYNFPVIPTVHSLNPLWDGKSLASMEEHRHDYNRTMTSTHLALRTSELDTRVEKIMPMPEETPVPFATAVLLTAFFISMLVGAYHAAEVSFGLCLAVVAFWLWRRPGIDEPEEAEEL